MAKKKKGKGFFSAIGSALGSIPVVGKVKKAAKAVKKQIKTAKKKVEKTVKKVKKKVKKAVKKKVGKVYTKARKIKNNLSKSKIVKKVKKAAKKAVLATKKAVKKAKAVVSKAKQQVKTVVKQTKQVMKEKVLPVVKKAAKATTKVVINAVQPKNLLDGLQLGLDIAGLIPGLGEIADGVNAAIYLARGDKVNAALSLTSMIPFAGYGASAVKFGKRIDTAIDKGKDVIKSAKEVLAPVKGKVTKQVENVKGQAKSPTPTNPPKQQAPSSPAKTKEQGTAKESNTKKDTLESNRKKGKDYENKEFKKFSEKYSNAVEQVTIKTESGTKTRVDAIGLDNKGNVVIVEFKSSKTAPLTKNQEKAFPEIFKSGGQVVGKGKGIFTKDYQIPKGTEIKITRPAD
jgi:hypothetical protein